MLISLNYVKVNTDIGFIKSLTHTNHKPLQTTTKAAPGSVQVVMRRLHIRRLYATFLVSAEEYVKGFKKSI